jgi:hypothetical protein
MARRRVEQDQGEVDPVELAEEEEDLLVREVGTLVEEPMIPFEIRKDGSVAHFSHEAAALVREVGV